MNSSTDYGKIIAVTLSVIVAGYSLARILYSLCHDLLSFFFFLLPPPARARLSFCETEEWERQ